MGRSAGFKSGEIYAEKIKAKKRYVINKEWIPASSLFSPGEAGTVTKAYGTSGSDRNFVWMSFASATEQATCITTVVPAGLDSDVQVNVKPYWIAALKGTNKPYNANVVWDIDYITVRPYISGAAVASGTVKYRLSGVVASNVTVTAQVQSGILGDTYKGVSGTYPALNVSTLTIPKGAVKGGDFMHLMFYRDADEATDNADAPANVVGILLEYVEG